MFAKYNKQELKNAFIKSGGNASAALRAVNPKLKETSIKSNASKIIARYGIKEEIENAIREYTAKDPELNPINLVDGFKEDLKANKTVFYKGKRYDDVKDNAVRASTRLALFDRLYCPKKDGVEVNVDNRSVSITEAGGQVLNDIVASLKDIKDTLEKDRVRRAKAIN